MTFIKGHTFYKGGEKGWFKKGERKMEKNCNWKGGITHPMCKVCGNPCTYRCDYCKKCSADLYKNEGNPKWVGDKADYNTLHSWVRRHLGKAAECVYCGEDEKRLTWASISHHAKRDLSDYIPLCVTCHSEYDRKARI